MEFRLTAQACLSQFTIVIYGVANLSFNVTRAEAAKGTVLYNLDPDVISPVDICDVKSVIYGGNVIGNSTPFDILPPKSKLSLAIPIATYECQIFTHSWPCIHLCINNRRETYIFFCPSLCKTDKTVCLQS